ncbi:MAG: DNA methyltransferase [Promethearchaeota archaeon]
MIDNQFHVQRYFCLLSGENPELAAFEFESILSTLGISTQTKISPDSRVLEFWFLSKEKENLFSKNASLLMKRVTMSHFCCHQLFQIDYHLYPPSTFNELISLFDISVVQDLTPNRSFSVTTKRIGEPKGLFQNRDLTQRLSRFIGAQILETNPSKNVNLDNPEEQFISILSEHGFWFGHLISYSLRREVRGRSVHKRPFFHPSSMNPLLQRTMINLAALKPGEWLLDPFCGSGGALVEASRMGIQSIGVEINRKMLWGAYQNLKADKIANQLTSLVFGDATQLSIRKGAISAVVTDPPYGTASSTRGISLQKLLIHFFHEIYPLLSPRARVVVAMPSHIKIEEQAARILNAPYRSFLQYVHRSLTRKILVFTVSKGSNY